MSSSISQVINNGTSSTANSSTSTANSAISESEFLTLLTTQLQNQDPLNPMDNTQSVAELAQFSALQSQTQLASQFQTFQSNFSVMQSAGLIGQQVSAQYTDANGNTQTVSGTIQTISVVNGTPEFTLAGTNGQLLTDANGNTLLIPTTGILSIGAAPSSSGSSGSGSGS
ncbi:MAG TPA: flagellar hook capping FlgD N-terminal domain-containing protein [Candidatus Sulfotelmatobacter sp.]|nr:flagellar hook capping FlgD N-terminal domain-containing protein [Candidatus Sulfotelmatobacter sp.]